jgi:PIN domain nuclease of toxin-antitoxin system
VRLLLDTHVVLWWLAGDPRVGADVKQLIDHEPDVFVSSASIWEISIKHARGKLEGPDDLTERVLGSGLGILDVTGRHGVAAGRLPPHHRDPFDRMLVAQAALEELTLVTADRQVQRYDVPLLKV